MERGQGREDGLMHELGVDCELRTHSLHGLGLGSVKRAAGAKQRDDCGFKGSCARGRGRGAARGEGVGGEWRRWLRPVVVVRRLRHWRVRAGWGGEEAGERGRGGAMARVVTWGGHGVRHCTRESGGRGGRGHGGVACKGGGGGGPGRVSAAVGAGGRGVHGDAGGGAVLG